MLCCEILCDEIFKFMLSNDTKLTNVYITSTFKKTVLALNEILTKELDGSTDHPSAHGEKQHDTAYNWKKLCNRCNKEMDAKDAKENTCKRCSEKSQRQQLEALPTKSFSPRHVHPFCTMSQEIIKLSLAGYKCDTIRITYDIPSGIQIVRFTWFTW